MAVIRRRDRKRRDDVIGKALVKAEDIELTLAEGSVFTADSTRGVAALVLLGKGTMRFRPTPQVEREQIRLFAGSETLEAPFEAAFVRLGTLEGHADLTSLTAKPVDAREQKRAEDVFREESAKTFAVDLSTFSGQQLVYLADPRVCGADLRFTW